MLYTLDIFSFKEAKSYGDILVVSITPDKFVKGFNKPYFDELQRAQFLNSLEIIDYVVVNDGKSSTSIINELNHQYTVKDLIIQNQVI